MYPRMWLRRQAEAHFPYLSSFRSFIKHMNFNRLVIAGVAALAVTGTAFATPNVVHRMHNAMSGKVQNINMGELNESKQTGTAVVRVSQAASGSKSRFFMSRPAPANQHMFMREHASISIRHRGSPSRTS